MQHITDGILRQAVDLQGQVFDTHDVIETITRLAPQEYTLELNRYVNSDDPILSIHPQVGQRLATFTDVIRPMGKVTSTNIGGNETLNDTWEKL